MAIDEKSYIMGSRSTSISMIRQCLSNLNYDITDPVTKIASLVLEREETIHMLRRVCEEFGDNNWEEDLHLADIIDKHLARHLYERIK